MLLLVPMLDGGSERAESSCKERVDELLLLLLDARTRQ